MFCKFCGKEKVEEWTGMFKETNGEKEMRLICSDKPCEHDTHNALPNSSGGGYWFGYDAICARCGIKLYFPSF